MAFSNLTSTEIEVGKAIKKELFSKTKDNFADHETRINNFEGASKKIIVFNELVINAAQATSLTGIGVHRATAAFTLTDAKVVIFTKGSLTGTLEMDIKKGSNSNPSAASTVFTTRPSIAYASASDYQESSNAVFDNNNKTLALGNYLFLNITSLPSGGTIGKFIVYLIGEV